MSTAASSIDIAAPSGCFPLAVRVGMISPDCGGIRDLHDLCGRLHFLYRQKFVGSDAEGSARVPVFTTICLLSSSLTIHMAVMR